MSDSRLALDVWSEFKLLVEQVEEDVHKNATKGNLSAGVRVRGARAGCDRHHRGDASGDGFPDAVPVGGQPVPPLLRHLLRKSLALCVVMSSHKLHHTTHLRFVKVRNLLVPALRVVGYPVLGVGGVAMVGVGRHG